MIISVPLALFLYAYFLLIGLFLIFFFIDIRHLFFTGSITMLSFFITFIVLARAVLSIFFTWQFLGGVDWQQNIKLFDQAWLSAKDLSF